MCVMPLEYPDPQEALFADLLKRIREGKVR